MKPTLKEIKAKQISKIENAQINHLLCVCVFFSRFCLTDFAFLFSRFSAFFFFLFCVFESRSVVFSFSLFFCSFVKRLDCIMSNKESTWVRVQELVCPSNTVHSHHFCVLCSLCFVAFKHKHTTNANANG